jgi:hypothetical protein
MLMPGYAHSVVYAMAREMYGKNEVNRYMMCFYGFDESNAGPSRGAKDGKSRIGMVGRRISGFVSASLAVLL